MDFFAIILWPFKWVMSWILGAFHTVLDWLGMDPDSGLTWTLSIILLVILVRTLLIPLFVKQIKSQRAMQAMQPEIQKLQAKYKGKTDQLSRQAMAMEQQALFKEHGTSPFAACLPMLVQMPFFFALFQILSGAGAAAERGEGEAAAQGAHQGEVAVLQFHDSANPRSMWKSCSSGRSSVFSRRTSSSTRAPSSACCGSATSCAGRAR